MKCFDPAALMEFLKAEERRHLDTAAALFSDSRADEANFEKIRANVFGIFSAVLNAAVKAVGEAKAEEFFRKKLREIPSGWRSALAAARERGDNAAALVEKLKLDSVAEIEGRLKQ